MKLNILKWCDDMITNLKENNIAFENGVAVMPKEFIYQDEVSMVSTYKYRNDIPDCLKKSSLLSYFMPDDNLFNRIKKIEVEIPIMKEYGGICGFDMSPSVGMLRPRQRFSILINSVFNAYCGLHGVKILPNSRVGDLGTMSMSKSFPEGVNFITGRHGCNLYGFKGYGLQCRMLLLTFMTTYIKTLRKHHSEISVCSFALQPKKWVSTPAI